MDQVTLTLIYTDAIVGGLDLFSSSSDEEWCNRGKALQSAFAAKGKHPDCD